MGSTIKGGVRNVYAVNCDFDDGTDTGIRIKSNRDCGSVVENLWFKDIRMGTILKHAVIMAMYCWSRGAYQQWSRACAAERRFYRTRVSS